MNFSIKNSAYLSVCTALIFTVCSCGNNSTTSSTTTDSTTMSNTVVDSNKTAILTDSTANSKMNNAPAASNVDKNTEFVNDVTKANNGEIQMLQSGIDNGTNKMLKDNAKKMIADHKSLAKKMSDYAAKNNITVADADGMPDMSSLNGKTGNDWDKAWVDMMVEGHQKTIDRFNKGENEVTDPELKGMITKTLPTLHKHLDMVTALQNKMK